MNPSREWMYNRIEGKYLSKVFVEKVDEFIRFACAQDEFQRYQKLKCPCVKCRNIPYLDVDTIKLHLYQRGFRPNYYRWVCHGETFLEDDGMPTSSCNAQVAPNPMRDMVMDAYCSTSSSLPQDLDGNEEHEPHPEAKRFLELLKAAERPPYEVDASGERSCCDAHAQSVYEKYEQPKADTDVQGASAADDHLFLKACGGWSEKGTIYGLGREDPTMYERPTKSRRSLCSTSSAYSTSVVAQLQDQLQTTQSELQTTQYELQTTRNELQMTRNELQTTQARLHATEEELQSTRKQLEDQRLGLLELNARFESFSALLGHPTRMSNSQSSS